MSTHHAGHARQQGRGRVLLALCVTLAVVVTECIAGTLGHSTALLADAMHSLLDSLALCISYVAAGIALKPPDRTHTYGYGRAEDVGALVGATLLCALACGILVQAVERVLTHVNASGVTMSSVGTVALSANLLNVALLWRVRSTSANFRVAFLHAFTDALSSVGVIVAGVIIQSTGWSLIDPIVSLCIGVYILWQGWLRVRMQAHILMGGVPDHLNLDEVTAAIQSHHSVLEAHDVHITSFGLSAHIRLDNQHLERATQIVVRLKRMLIERFGIHHSTIEVETHCSVPPEHGNETPNAPPAR